MKTLLLDVRKLTNEERMAIIDHYEPTHSHRNAMKDREVYFVELTGPSSYRVSHGTYAYALSRQESGRGKDTQWATVEVKEKLSYDVTVIPIPNPDKFVEVNGYTYQLVGPAKEEC